MVHLPESSRWFRKVLQSSYEAFPTDAAVLHGRLQRRLTIGKRLTVWPRLDSSHAASTMSRSAPAFGFRKRLGLPQDSASARFTARHQAQSGVHKGFHTPSCTHRRCQGRGGRRPPSGRPSVTAAARHRTQEYILNSGDRFSRASVHRLGASRGPKIRICRRCVSRPFWWFTCSAKDVAFKCCGQEFIARKGHSAFGPGAELISAPCMTCCCW